MKSSHERWNAEMRWCGDAQSKERLTKLSEILLDFILLSFFEQKLFKNSYACWKHLSINILPILQSVSIYYYYYIHSWGEQSLAMVADWYKIRLYWISYILLHTRMMITVISLIYLLWLQFHLSVFLSRFVCREFFFISLLLLFSLEYKINECFHIQFFICFCFWKYLLQCKECHSSALDRKKHRNNMRSHMNSHTILIIIISISSIYNTFYSYWFAILFIQFLAWFVQYFIMNIFRIYWHLQ